MRTYAIAALAPLVLAMLSTGQCTMGWVPANLLNQFPAPEEIQVGANGVVYLGLLFPGSSGSGNSNSALRRWSGSTWTSIGGVAQYPGSIQAIVRQVMTIDPCANGDVIVTGWFESPSVRATIARWNGVSLTFLDNELAPGGQLMGAGKCIELLDGRIVSCVGGFHVFDGVHWSLLTDANGRYPTGLADLDQQGNIVFLGSMIDPAAPSPLPGGGSIYRFNSASNTFSHLGGSYFISNTIFGIEVMPDGNVLAYGRITSHTDIWDPAPAELGGVALWDGSSWGALGGGGGIDGGVTDVHLLPNGDVVASGAFPDNQPATHSMAVYRGGGWFPVGLAFTGPGGGVYPVMRLAALEMGWDVWAAGPFDQVNGTLSRSVAKVSVIGGCSPSVASLGNGCFGAGGMNNLIALTLPWRGTVFQSRASGLAASNIPIAVVGFSQVIAALGSFLPSSHFSCWLMASPDLFLFGSVVAGAGTQDFAIAIPTDPSLIGLRCYQQAVNVEWDPVVGIIDSSSSNCLEVKIGSW